MRRLSRTAADARSARPYWRDLAFAELDLRLEQEVAAPLAVAFSGGGDSVALLALAAEWSARRRRPLLALTVDHGLHPESAAWTRAAGEQARAMGAAWRGLDWRGAKPTNGLPAAARRARHALIADAARRAGARVVLFGHTTDDAREGERMRAIEGVAIGRLRAWSPSPAWPEGRGVFLLRTLLQARRAELRAWLGEQGIGWRDDPANLDLRFARPRARAALASAPESQVHRLPGAVSLDAAWTAEGASGWAATVDGRLRLSRSRLSAEALAAALLCASGASVPPRAESLNRLLDRLLKEGSICTADDAWSKSVLAGAGVQAAGAMVEFTREAGERGRGGLAPIALVDGEPTVWDGRFELVADGPGLVAAAVAGRAARLSGTDRTRLRTFPPAARAALPLLVAPDGGVSLPRPFGEGPAYAQSLAGARFAAATGGVAHERDLSR